MSVINAKLFLRFFLAASVCLLFFMLPIKSYFYDGPYSWHLWQPSVYQGIIELCVVFLVTFVLFFMFFIKQKRYAIFLWGVFFAAFLRNHNLDVPLTVAVFYFNFLYFIGSSLKNEGRDIVCSIIIGAVLWVTILLILSFFNKATPQIMWLIILLIGLYSFLSKKHNMYMIILSRISFRNTSKIDIAALSVLIVYFVAICLKTNHPPTFDEVWYLLRGGQILNRHGSFFENIIYPNMWVAYYPKFYEILIFPLEYFDNFAFSKSMSFGFYIITCSVIYRIIGDSFQPLFGPISGVNSRPLSLLLLSLPIISIPVLASQGVSTKPDGIAILFFLYGWYLFLQYIKLGKLENLITASLLVGFVVSIRLIALPYSGCALILFLAYRFLRKPTNNDIPISTVFIWSFFIICFFLLITRTFLLTGVPFVQLDGSELISKLYNAFGFQYKYPFERSQAYSSEHFLPTPILFFRSLFEPQGVRASFDWFSNYFLFLALISWYVALKTRAITFDLNAGSLYIILGAVMAVLLNHPLLQGGDGNYYIIPVVFSSLMMTRYVQNRITLSKVVAGVIIAYTAFNFMIFFIINPFWTPGTAEVKLDFSSNPFGRVDYKETIIRNVEMSDVMDQLPIDNSDCYLFGIAPRYQGYVMGCSFLSAKWLEIDKPVIFSDFKAFIRFLKEGKINYLIYPKFAPQRQFVEYSKSLESCKGIETFRGRSYLLVKINDISLIERCSNNLPEEKRMSDELSVFGPERIVLGVHYTEQWMKDFQMLPVDDSEEYYIDPVVVLGSGGAAEYLFNVGSERDWRMFFQYGIHYKLAGLEDINELAVEMFDGEGKQIVNEKLFVFGNEIGKFSATRHLHPGKYQIKLFFKRKGEQYTQVVVSKPRIE